MGGFDVGLVLLCGERALRLEPSPQIMTFLSCQNGTMVFAPSTVLRDAIFDEDYDTMTMQGGLVRATQLHRLTSGSDQNSDVHDETPTPLHAGGDTISYSAAISPAF
eukprot:SAG11_NODE_17349_length_521_cov_0.827014_1_plen_106_part_10